MAYSFNLFFNATPQQNLCEKKLFQTLQSAVLKTWCWCLLGNSEKSFHLELPYALFLFILHIVIIISYYKIRNYCDIRRKDSNFTAEIRSTVWPRLTMTETVWEVQWFCCLFSPSLYNQLATGKGGLKYYRRHFSPQKAQLFC